MSLHRPRPRALLVPSLLAALVPSACLGTRSAAEPVDTAPATTWSYASDVALTRAPYTEVHADWKQRLDQPYVFLEHQGSYVDTGRLIPEVHRLLADQGLVAAGPPFALFYDDPGTVAVEQLSSRACVPVSGRVAVGAPLRFDVLPSTTVAYAVVAGPYPELPRSYPGLYAYLASMGWVENGPVREVYLVPPGSVADWSELRAEVQVPAAPGP